MNETLQLLQSHRSDRSFTDQAVSEEDLAAIIKSAHCAPTSINSQDVSLIVIRDPARRAKIAEYADNRSWIAKAPVIIVVLMDLYKTSIGASMAGEEQVIHETIEGVLAGSIDVGITLNTLMVAARSLGLGVVPVGGIRAYPQEMIDLLGLPRRTFPLACLCLGHVKNPAAQKPRLSIETFCHYEEYHSENLQDNIEDYDKKIVTYWKQIVRTDGQSWSTTLGSILNHNYRPFVKAALEKQGFKTNQ